MPPPLDLTPTEHESLDSVCGVQILQRLSGYRFNLDPVLLAHFAADAGLKGPAVDLGTGSAIIPLILAKKFRRSKLTALEVQPQLYDLAARNVHLNHCERRVAVVQGDLRHVRQLFPREGFAHVTCNPPYREAQSGHISREPEKAIARHEVMCSFADVAAAASYLLRHRGTLDVIYPAARLNTLMATLDAHALIPRRIRMIHPRQGRSAKLVLLRAAKVEFGDLEVLPPLILHPHHGEYSEEVDRMFAEKGGDAERQTPLSGIG